MIKVRKQGDDYFINDKKVVDPLEFNMEERMALEAFKKAFVDMHVQSSIKTGDKMNDRTTKM